MWMIDEKCLIKQLKLIKFCAKLDCTRKKKMSVRFELNVIWDEKSNFWTDVIWWIENWIHYRQKHMVVLFAPHWRKGIEKPFDWDKFNRSEHIKAKFIEETTHTHNDLQKGKKREHHHTIHKCQLKCHANMLNDERWAPSFFYSISKSLIKPTSTFFLLFKVYICGQLRANTSQQAFIRTKLFYFSHFDKLTNSTANRSICICVLFACETYALC